MLLQVSRLDVEHCRLIVVEAVCKGYQQMIKVVTSGLRGKEDAVVFQGKIKRFS